MPQNLFGPADICLPRVADMTRWSVVACDQYTSEPAYWNEVERTVGDAPSTLRLVLPELYLEQPEVENRISAIGAAMRRYVDDGILEVHPNCCIYLERTLADGRVRRGLIGAVDLEAYDFSVGSVSPLRATEGTVLSRIPPRLAVRKDALLELPHVMVLLDDPDKTVIEPLSTRTGALEQAYDFDLMQSSGHVRGWFVRDADWARVDEALTALADPALLRRKYPGTTGTLLFAVGDGNHSLATAKSNFEELKKTMPESQWRRHPARYALVELVNVHDEALGFEPIHRVLFDVEPSAVLAALAAAFDTAEVSSAGAQRIRWCYGDQAGSLWIANPTSNLAVGTLQGFLDQYLAAHGGRIDYIHGDDVTAALARQPGCLGFLLPAMQKNELFQTVLLDGVLPRKTFSMGHACDKRFYLEARFVKQA